MTIEEMLDEYGMIKAQVDLINMDRDAKRAIIQASIQAELDALEAEYKPLTELDVSILVRKAFFNNTIEKLLLQYPSNDNLEKMRCYYNNVSFPRGKP